MNKTQLNSFSLTKHVGKRMQQRGIHQGDLIWILQYGFITERAGAHIYTLPAKRVPHALVPPQQAERLGGLTVVCKSDGTIMTAYYDNSLRRKRTSAARMQMRRPVRHSRWADERDVRYH